HVVFLDHNRRSLLGTPYEEMLACVRCGACLNVCPVYRRIGGHAYDAVYSGPMGAVLTPLLSGGSEGRDLPDASSLCGACTGACPTGYRLSSAAARRLGRLAPPALVRRTPGVSGWGEGRDIPLPAARSFRQRLAAREKDGW